MSYASARSRRVIIRSAASSSRRSGATALILGEQGLILWAMVEPGEDGRLGQLAVARGWLTASDLSDALREIDERRRGGEKIALGRHLVEGRLLSGAQVRELLADQDKQVLVCSSTRCAKRYNIRHYRPSQAYRCKDCGARLAAPRLDRTEMVLADGDEAGESAAALPVLSEPLAGDAWSTQFGPTLTPSAAVRLAEVPGPRRPEGRFGRYVEAVELARGGMGAVYRAVDPDLGRPVAIKVALAGEDALSEEVARFLREAQVTGQLQHPNIPPLHELSRTPDGQTYFAMKLIDGKSLADLVQDRVRQGAQELAASRPEFLGALVKVCDALAYAHSRGVIHRDLKPANVMIGAYGEVLVLDWGIARILGTSDVEAPAAPARARAIDPVRTLEGTAMGTPAYMSPEQVDGRLDEIDRASDVYGLGAVIYEVLTGTPPFAGKTIDEIFEKIVRGACEPPSRRTPAAAIPAELDRLAGKAMHLRRAKRYGSAEEVKAELQAYLEGRPLAAVRYSAWQRVAKWIRRNRAVSGVSASAAVLLSVLVAWLFVALRESRANLKFARESAAAEAAQRHVADEERDRTSAALEEVLALSEAAPLAGRLSEEERLAAWRGFPASTAALEAWLSSAAKFEGRRAPHERRIREIEARGDRRESDAWEKDNRRKLLELLGELERAIEIARDGLERARRLRERSEGREERAAWEEAAQQGLTLPRAAGIVPIGLDPESKRWEFWLVESGDRPERGSDGRLGAGTGIVLVLLPGGTFRMGSEESPIWNERPEIDVTLPSFLISKYELTRGQWARASGAAAAIDEARALEPVAGVRWTECRRTLLGWGLRLPSEAEWEFAARAGTTGDWWTDDLATAGNVCERSGLRSGFTYCDAWDDGEGMVCRVGRYRANPFGLHDSIGNLSEWVEDAYFQDLSETPRDGSPRRDPAEPLRVIRGGSFGSVADRARASHRIGFARDLTSLDLGLRPAMDVPGR